MTGSVHYRVWLQCGPPAGLHIKSTHFDVSRSGSVSASLPAAARHKVKYLQRGTGQICDSEAHVLDSKLAC